MTRISFTREITIEYSTRSFEKDEVPEILRSLFEGPTYDDGFPLFGLVVEEQDALDEFLSDAEWTLGETLSTTDRRLVRQED